MVNQIRRYRSVFGPKFWLETGWRRAHQHFNAPHIHGGRCGVTPRGPDAPCSLCCWSTGNDPPCGKGRRRRCAWCWWDSTMDIATIECNWLITADLGWYFQTRECKHMIIICFFKIYDHVSSKYNHIIFKAYQLVIPQSAPVPPPGGWTRLSSEELAAAWQHLIAVISPDENCATNIFEWCECHSLPHQDHQVTVCIITISVCIITIVKICVSQ